MAGIAHKNLTDPQLHEPKGASTADAGSLCFADGNGGTGWRKAEVADLDFTPAAVSDATESSASTPGLLDYTGLAGDTDGILNTATNFTQVNKNFKEIGVMMKTYRDAYDTLRLEHVRLINEFNALITALKNTGFIQ